jgi:acyl-CoA synthetase (AMP-forming)/AMP-acid ligase II
LHLRGRAKDMIIRGGVNIYPADIESALTALDGVADAAVVGMPSKEFGEEVCAFVVARGLDEDALLTGCSERLARYKVPRRIILMDSLPKTPLGKIDKKALAGLAAAAA